MRNSAPGRCRYIRERDRAGLPPFSRAPSQAIGRTPKRTGKNDGRQAKDDVRRDPTHNRDYVSPVQKAAFCDHPPANGLPHEANRPAHKKQDARRTSGDTALLPRTARNIFFAKRSRITWSAATKRNEGIPATQARLLPADHHIVSGIPQARHSETRNI